MEVFNAKYIIFAIALFSVLSLYKVEANAGAPAPAPAQSKEAENTVKTYCDKTDFPSECVSSITPLLSGNDVDGYAVLQAGMKALTQRINEAIVSFENGKNNEKVKTNDLAERVEVCLAYYRVATTSAQEAEAAITAMNFDQVKKDLYTQYGVIGDCDDLFAETVKGQKGPLEDVNTALNKLAKINLALAENVLPSQ